MLTEGSLWVQRRAGCLPQPSLHPQPIARQAEPVSHRIPFKIGQPKKQIVPKTVERDFEREYGKLQQLEEQTKRLQKDLKKSTDADLAMSKSAVKISLDLLSNPLCEQDQDFLNMVTALDTAMKRMDAFNQEKVNQIQKTVIEPLKKFGSVFPSLNMAVKRREQALQDYRRLQAKVEKYEEKEKTGPVLAKLHQAREELRPVRDDFEAKNKQLLDEMPRFYNSRLDYFQPSFESLIRAQVTTFGDLDSAPLQPSGNLAVRVWKTWPCFPLIALEVSREGKFLLPRDNLELEMVKSRAVCLIVWNTFF
ncbi:bridging integrator 3 isoform X2 [Sus scrofa]|uniref:bridging integrator 3 isoform X2 n=1 Tax=Sus scrofa TaxID=9823 RepID=UPI000A2B2F07|nr:bridging integrator 3 isoform X2 [Sus scrofa]